MVKIKLILVAVLIAVTNLSGIAQNSVPNTPEEKRQAFLTPQYYTNWLGASFLTIPTVEKEFAVEPVQIVDLTFFYDFGDCFVDAGYVGGDIVENKRDNCICRPENRSRTESEPHHCRT